MAPTTRGVRETARVTRPEPAVLLALAVDLAARAGALALSMREGVEVASTKSSPTDVVTAADAAAERLVVDGLRSARPGASAAAHASPRWRRWWRSAPTVPTCCGSSSVSCDVPSASRMLAKKRNCIFMTGRASG